MWKAPIMKYETNGTLLYHYSHIWMWELDHREDWAPKNWCFRTVVLGKALENPLDCMEIKPVNPKGNQPWIVFGRADAEAVIFWLPDAKNRLIEKDCDARKDWRQEEKGATEDEMVGWHHRLSGASPVTLTVKRLPAMQETRVCFLDQEDPLEKGMATHSSIPA